MPRRSWSKGLKLTDEKYKVGGRKNKGRKQSAETIEKKRKATIGLKRTDETRELQRIRAKETHRNPLPTEINTVDLCDYGCGQIAKYKFLKGKICCSAHYNSCPGKRNQFSDRTDHKERNAKSLETRIRTGVTKSSQIKGATTRKEQGFYEKQGKRMQELWATAPWNPNLHCQLIPYKDTDVNYQGTFEHKFLEKLELKNGLDWIKQNVRRGPSIWYIDPTNNTKRLYISDFIIYNIIYKIKSGWTWNKHGKDTILEARNKAKLNQCLIDGYKVILILDEKEIEYDKWIMD